LNEIGRRRFLTTAGMLVVVAAGESVLRSDAVLAQSGGAGIDNVLVMTSVRQGRITLRIDYHLEAPAPGAAFRVQVTELDGTVAGLPSGRMALSQTGAGTWEQDVTLVWANPRLWDVEDPYLYVVKVWMEPQSGAPVVYPPVRFGFREVWRVGKDLYLNDHPLKLRQMPFISSTAHLYFYGGMGMNTIEFQPNPGAWNTYPPTAVGGASQTGSEAIFDLADELGIIVMMPTINLRGYKDGIEKDDPAVTASYMGMVRQANKEFDKQNRPSIIAWLPAMNEVSNAQSPRHTNDPDVIGQHLPPNNTPPDAQGRQVERTPLWVEKSMGLLKAEDPTRLVVFHEVGRVSDMHFANVYLNHYPLQEREDHLATWAADGDMPWGAAEFGPPATMPLFRNRLRKDAVSDGIPYFTEFIADYLGDVAYESETDVFVDDVAVTIAEAAPAQYAIGENFQKLRGLDHIGDSTAFFPYVDLFVRNTNKSFRAWGANAGWHPWIQDVGFGHNSPTARHAGNRHIEWGYEEMNENLTQEQKEELANRPAWANPIYDAYRATLQPLLVFLAGPPERFTVKDHNYRAGETANHSIVAVWDGPGFASVTSSWALKRADGSLVPGASGTETFDLAPGTVTKRPITFQLPTTVVTALAAARRRTSGSSVAVAADVTLTLETTHTGPAGEVLSVTDDSLALKVFPSATAPAPTKRWRIYDPVGKTTSELLKLGFTAPPVTVGSDLSAVDVLIVGTQVLGNGFQLPATPGDIERGLRVVVFEQSQEALQAMGFRTDDIMPRYTFPRVGEHPILSGIDEASLINWRGAGELLPLKKRNDYPIPDRRMHLGNQGSVASVVIETPHQGAFTPIIESSFDLAYSPLLEWRHGTGNVVFCQLDLTGRIGLEPAADRLMANIISYLDSATLAGPAANRKVVFVGSDAADRTLLDQVGFDLRTADPASLGLQPTDLVVIGRGVVNTLSAAAKLQLTSHVQAGGTVVFLPRGAAEIGLAPWPWAIGTQNRSIARVLPGAESAPLTRALGPQLTRWRRYQTLDVITGTGLPADGVRHLDGLLGTVDEGSGQWVISQCNWRDLNDGTNNTRRPTWNSRRFYRQLLTNLGARSRASVAAGILPPGGSSPLVNLGPWRAAGGPVLGNAAVPGQGGFRHDVLPGLSAAYAVTPFPTASGQVISDANGDGYVDLSPVALTGNNTPEGGPTFGSVAYAHTFVYSTAARTATLEIGPAYWMTLRVNSTVVWDDSVDGCYLPSAGQYPPSRVGVNLRAGWNKLEIGVCTPFVSTYYGDNRAPHVLGFFIRTEDPGDLRVDAGALAPPLPIGVPAPVHSTTPIDFYMEPKPRPEDVYHYCTY